MAARTLSDRSIIKRGRKGAHGAATRRYPLIIGGIIWLIDFVISAAAFSVRVVFRSNLGERTYGIGLIIFGYMWTRYFMAGKWEIETLNVGYKFFSRITERASELDTLLYPFYALTYYIYQFLSNLALIFESIRQVIPDEKSFLIFWYSYLVVILGFIHLVKATKRSWTHDKAYSFNRGKSLFLDWLKGRSITIRGKTFKIKDSTIWVILEPLVVILLGFCVFNFYGDTNFALFLVISGLALFWEEYREYLSKRDELLDIIDAEYRGEEIEKELREFDEKNKSRLEGRVSPKGATLVKPEDYTLYHNYILSQRNNHKKSGAKVV